MVFPGYDQPSPERPIRCGRYELIERIGYGGMAEVFKARLPGPAGFAKTVVIKRILPRLLDDNLVVRMFVEEAKIAAAADHDNIARVFELGQAEDGKYFMVMEYIHGIDLEMMLAGAAKRTLRVPPWFGVHVVAEVLEALSFVHGLVDDDGRPRNVIHRDATPSNIFVSYRGQVKLSDFGVADFEGKSPTTRAGQLKGKLSYMSPEQLNGQMLDQRSDIFSMGVVLWEILTQQRLFGGLNEMQAMIAICEGERRAPSTLVPGIPAALDRVTLKALSATRDDRYPYASEFQADLLEVLHQMHRPVRHGDVQDVLHVLLGRQEPTDDLLDRSSPDGVLRESSFLLPIEEPEAALESTYVRQESEAITPKVNEVPSLHDTADVTENVAIQAEESQDATISVGPEELKRMMAAYAPPTVGPLPAVAAPRQATPAAPTPTSAPSNPAAPGLGPQFWLRSRQGKKSEPLGWAEVTRRLDQGAFAGGSLSADETHWIGVEEVARLVGDDRFVEPASAASNVSTVGSLKERSLVSLLSLHARDRSSGVLAFARSDQPGLEWFELHLHDGRPTRLVSNVAGAQIPSLLAARSGLPEGMLASLLYAAVKERRPLLEVAQSRGISVLAGDRGTVARLSTLCTWRNADYTFTLDATPTRNPPLVDSLLRIVPAAIEEAVPTPRLLELLGPRLERRYEPSWRLADGLRELHLEGPALTVAQRLSAQVDLKTLLTQLPERVVLVTGYVLIEADLLVEAL